MSLIAAALVAGAVISAAASKKSAGKQAGAVKSAKRMSVAEQRRQFDLTRRDTAPYRRAGRNALTNMQGMLSGDEDFTASPGYQFRVDEGTKGITNYLAGQGSRLSGRALKELERFRQGTASDEFQNQFARYGTLAGFGQGGVQMSSQAGANAANAISNTAMNTGNQLSNIYGNQAANMNNAVQGGLNNWVAYNQQQNMMNAYRNAMYRQNPVQGDAYMPAYR